MSITTESANRCFAGTQYVYSHDSSTLGCRMRFAAYVPDGVEGPAPTWLWLSGLTCTEENFTAKAGAQRVASELGLVASRPTPRRGAKACPTTPTARGTSDWARAST